MSDFMREYEEYLYYFDPTPQYADDGYSMPLEYDDWVLERMDEIGLF